MTVSAITSEKPFVVERDIKCRECGYNVRGLVSTGNCPECGHPVSLSITDSMESFLRALPPDARRNLRVDMTFEPYGMWITGVPLVISLLLIATMFLAGLNFGAWGGLLGAGFGLISAKILAAKLINWRERRAVGRYLSRHCVDRRLNRCPLCYRDLSGAMADTCPECGCPVSVRRLA